MLGLMEGFARAWPVSTLVGVGWVVAGGIWLAVGGPGQGLVFIGLACLGMGVYGARSAQRCGPATHNPRQSRKS
jgi:hypothetical protein